MKNTTIKITQIGKRYFNFEVTIYSTQDNIPVERSYTGTACSGEKIEILLTNNKNQNG